MRRLLRCTEYLKLLPEHFSAIARTPNHDTTSMPTQTPACDMTSTLDSCLEANAMEVDNKTSVMPSPSHLHLMNLPQELQDMIFDYAYHRPCQSKIIPRGDWAVNQFRKQRFGATDGYIIKAYPGPKVSDFMVSKRYFVAAARAYVSSQPVCFTVQQGDDLTG